MISLSVPIILASQSPRRSSLLKQIGLSFSVVPSSIAEEIDRNATSEENVRRLSLHKAEEVARQYSSGVIIGSDTIVVIDGEVLGKPGSETEAKGMLKLLSGRSHTVYTGFALVDAASKKSYIDHVATEVTFRHLAEKEIAEYVATGSPMDKAGSYGIQDDFGAVFVERISGDYYTVVGLPLSKFYTAFISFAKQLGHFTS
ncbi:MAG: septum formation inhibitor Maf [Bacteroidetes bacterium]|nr:septum formation inhibitor Maf [Bacteroidota bacterium]